jgi:hypothetical protein
MVNCAASTASVSGYPPVALLKHTDDNPRDAGKKPLKKGWALDARKSPPEGRARYSKALPIATRHASRLADCNHGGAGRARPRCGRRPDRRDAAFEGEDEAG